MTQPCLPPRGVFVPTQIVFHPELPSAVLVTWIRLRSLAWKSWDTPPMNLPRLAAQLGIHPARLNRHLAMLQELSALSYRTEGQEKIIISFPEEPIVFQEALMVARVDTRPTMVHPSYEAPAATASYFPTRIMGYISYDDEEIQSTEGERAEQVEEPASLATCAQQEPAFLAK